MESGLGSDRFGCDLPAGFTASLPVVDELLSSHVMKNNNVKDERQEKPPKVAHPSPPGSSLCCSSVVLQKLNPIKSSLSSE